MHYIRGRLGEEAVHVCIILGEVWGGGCACVHYIRGRLGEEAVHVCIILGGGLGRRLCMCTLY